MKTAVQSANKSIKKSKIYVIHDSNSKLNLYFIKKIHLLKYLKMSLTVNSDMYTLDDGEKRYKITLT